MQKAAAGLLRRQVCSDRDQIRLLIEARLGGKVASRMKSNLGITGILINAGQGALA